MKFPSPTASIPGILFVIVASLVCNATDAVVTSVSVSSSHDETIVEIVSSAPVIPSIEKLEGPARLVIDLPNARLALKKKQAPFSNAQVGAVRSDQFRTKPSTARVVLELLQPISYSWDASGNRLMVRLRSEQPPVPPAVTGIPSGDQPLAIPVSSGNSGDLLLAGSDVSAGSSVTAGDDAAILSIRGGGEIRVCPGTTVSVIASSSGQDLTLGMSTGALEANYTLQTSADSVLTPDFRILLEGPGDFHYAISADTQGTTCVRALPGNTASATVSELLGNGSYHINAKERIVFRSGQLTAVDFNLPANCGCPAPAIPVNRAAEPPSGPIVSQTDLPQSVHLAQPANVEPQANNNTAPAETQSLSRNSPATSVASSQTPVAPPETGSLPALQPNEVRVQIEAPFVFRASDHPAAQPAPTREAAALSPSYASHPEPMPTIVQPPKAAVTSRADGKNRHGFLGKIKGFFSSVFH